MDGILLIDKPVDWTSNDVVQKVKRLLGLKKVGHAGTLDPMATGLLLLCMNKATKEVETLMHYPKTYEATVTLGQSTETADREGQVVEEMPVPALAMDTVNTMLDDFRGPIEQIPPMYSALKYKGKPLYRWAREGKVIERQPRPVKIYDLILQNIQGHSLSLTIQCSRGTYIRSLAVDIAQKLGTVGHLSQLRRTECGPFSTQQAITMAVLIQSCQEGHLDFRQYIIPMQNRPLQTENPMLA
jgi:tRNA pseudouridine55 synthase